MVSLQGVVLDYYRLVCVRFGFGPLYHGHFDMYHLSVLISDHFGLRPFWFAAIFVCGHLVCSHFCLWPFWFVAILVCDHFGLLPQ